MDGERQDCESESIDQRIFSFHWEIFSEYLDRKWRFEPEICRRESSNCAR